MFLCSSVAVWYDRQRWHGGCKDQMILYAVASDHAHSTQLGAPAAGTWTRAEAAERRRHSYPARTMAVPAQRMWSCCAIAVGMSLQRALLQAAGLRTRRRKVRVRLQHGSKAPLRQHTGTVNACLCHGTPSIMCGTAQHALRLNCMVRRASLLVPPLPLHLVVPKSQLEQRQVGGVHRLAVVIFGLPLQHHHPPPVACKQRPCAL